MKLIIEIDEETYNRAKNEPSILCGMNNGLIYQSNMKEAIANGTPYNPTGDLISREDLKETIELEEGIFWDSYSPDELVVRKKYIDNAPAVARPQGGLTGAEKKICKMYLEDLDKTHTCNEYKLLMSLIDNATTDENDCKSCFHYTYDGDIPYCELGYSIQKRCKKFRGEDWKGGAE